MQAWVATQTESKLHRNAWRAPALRTKAAFLRYFSVRHAKFQSVKLDDLRQYEWQYCVAGPAAKESTTAAERVLTIPNEPEAFGVTGPSTDSKQVD